MNENATKTPIAVVLAPCEFELDPRHGYWSKYVKTAGFDVIEVEVRSKCRFWNSEREIFQDGNRISTFAEKTIKKDLVPPYLKWLFEGSDTSTGAFLAARTLRQLNAVNHVILENLDVDLVIANDLGGMLLAHFIWRNSGAQIVYDAQEVFTDLYDLLSGESLSEDEKQKWIHLETFLCAKASRVVTVSPGIADLYYARHHIECTVIPNYVPIEKHLPTVHRNGPVKFVFIGRAEPHRGLEELITHWDFPAEFVSLDVILSESSHKNYLKKLNSRTKRRFSAPKICSPVHPDEIISTLNSYDIGIIPYNYSYPYSEASPNKFGEYIAAGLAVVTSDQAFVANVVNRLGIGLIYSWDQPQSFIAAIDSLANHANVNSFKTSVSDERIHSLNFEAGCDILFADLSLTNQNMTSRTEIVLEPLVESGQFVPSCGRWLRRSARNSVVRYLRLFGPLIRIIGRTSLGRSLAK